MSSAIQSTLPIPCTGARLILHYLKTNWEVKKKVELLELFEQNIILCSFVISEI